MQRRPAVAIGFGTTVDESARQIVLLRVDGDHQRCFIIGVGRIDVDIARSQQHRQHLGRFFLDGVDQRCLAVFAAQVGIDALLQHFTCTYIAVALDRDHQVLNAGCRGDSREGNGCNGNGLENFLHVV